MKNIIKLILFVFLILGLIFIFVHFYLIDRLGFFRLIYPVQANIALHLSRCSPEAPNWMHEAIKYAIYEQKNLSNQVAYIDNQQKLHHCESGWHGTPIISKKLNYEHRFRYASLTKILTSHAILKLATDKGISLNTPYIHIIEELKGKNYEDPRIKNITLMQLLEHRSGFDRNQSEDTVAAIDKKSWCPYDLVELTKQNLDFNPNTRYAYDNRNYCLLGVAIERLSGQQYKKFMESNYLLSKYNIKFANGNYYADEVKYDFRNSNYWTYSDDNLFDFNALSAAAGLSGSAIAFAKVVSTLVHNDNASILDISPEAKSKCHLNQFESCNGYAMWQYQPDIYHEPMYFRRGGLIAVTSLAIVTSEKEVMIWLGNGASNYAKNDNPYFLERYFYSILSD